MLKTRKATTIAFATAAAALIATFAVAPASQTDTDSEQQVHFVAAAQPVADACDGQAWPYQSQDCIAQIMADNGLENRNVRVLDVYVTATTPRERAYAEIARELRSGI